MNELSHINNEGKANMVDVGDKPNQNRVAKAAGWIQLQPQTLDLINKNLMKKGDVLTIAEIAGIQATKETSRLIPLCHNLMLTKVEVKATPKENGVYIESMVKCTGKTGVEMESLTAVSVALLTVYDMCKAVDKSMVISQIQLLSKEKTDL